jgi:hypothetical protein
VCDQRPGIRGLDQSKPRASVTRSTNQSPNQPPLISHDSAERRAGGGMIGARPLRPPADDPLRLQHSAVRVDDRSAPIKRVRSRAIRRLTHAPDTPCWPKDLGSVLPVSQRAPAGARRGSAGLVWTRALEPHHAGGWSGDGLAEHSGATVADRSMSMASWYRGGQRSGDDRRAAADDTAVGRDRRGSPDAAVGGVALTARADSRTRTSRLGQ